MSAALRVSFRAPVLPWAGSEQDDQRFGRVLRTVLIICGLLCLIELFAPMVLPDRSKPQAMSERVAAMILDSVPPVQPPAKPEAEQQKSELPKSDVTQPEAAPKPTLRKERPAPDARVPLPNRPAGEIDAARHKVAGVGLLASSADLAELRGAPVAVQLTPVKLGPGVGSGVGVGVGAGNEAGVPTRALITSNATGGSGGINTAGYSKNTGGGGLAGRSTTLVEGAIGGGGGGAASGHATVAGARSGVGAGAAGGNLQRGSSGKASRSIEEIKLVFEKNKGAIYAIYNRALREEPGLQGKVVLELKIAPAGNVLDCRIVSSDLKTPELEAKLLARIRQFDFGSKDVDQMVVTWPVDFLPS